jgi:hypothetical protein
MGGGDQEVESGINLMRKRLAIFILEKNLLVAFVFFFESIEMFLEFGDRRGTKEKKGAPFLKSSFESGFEELGSFLRNKAGHGAHPGALFGIERELGSIALFAFERRFDRVGRGEMRVVLRVP